MFPPGLDHEVVDFYELTLTLSDSFGNVVLSTLNVTVSDGLDPPTLTNLPDEVDILENVTNGDVIFNISATDIQGDPISYSITSFPDGPFYLTGPLGEERGNVYSKRTP